MTAPVPGDREPCRILGILNVTPDSFSDGGRHHALDAAVRHGLELRAEGADVVDVGGESTRPGAQRVSVDEELARVVPVVAELAAAGALVSIDTTRRIVAQTAVAAGAVMVNDVSGGTADPDMRRFVADAEVDYVVVHSRGPSADMTRRAHYGDVVPDVLAELDAAVERAVEAGVAAEHLAVDPGLGFAKRPEHDWRLLAELDRLHGLGLPVLLGASRKSFLGPVGAGAGPALPTDERDDATAAVTVIAAQAGVWGVRVHDVPGSVRAVGVVGALRGSRAGSERVEGTDGRGRRRMTWAS
jgi:dihydropteroate synthase